MTKSYFMQNLGIKAGSLTGWSNCYRTVTSQHSPLILDTNGDGKIDYNEFWQIEDKSEFWQAIENKSKTFKDPEALKKIKQSLNLALDTQMQLKLSESTLINMKQYLSNK